MDGANKLKRHTNNNGDGQTEPLTKEDDCESLNRVKNRVNGVNRIT